MIGLVACCAYGVILFLTTKKGCKKVARWPRGALNCVLFLYEANHPHLPVPFPPPPRVPHAPSAHTQHRHTNGTTAHTTGGWDLSFEELPLWVKMYDMNG